jgi:hypothetical protein
MAETSDERNKRILRELAGELGQRGIEITIRDDTELLEFKFGKKKYIIYPTYGNTLSADTKEV